jgi:hypothetical protein
MCLIQISVLPLTNYMTFCKLSLSLSFLIHKNKNNDTVQRLHNCDATWYPWREWQGLTQARWYLIHDIIVHWLRFCGWSCKQSRKKSLPLGDSNTAETERSVYRIWLPNVKLRQVPGLQGNHKCYYWVYCQVPGERRGNYELSCSQVPPECRLHAAAFPGEAASILTTCQDNGSTEQNTYAASHGSALGHTCQPSLRCKMRPFRSNHQLSDEVSVFDDGDWVLASPARILEFCLI